jgi:hypothetical protein
MDPDVKEWDGELDVDELRHKIFGLPAKGR